MKDPASLASPARRLNLAPLSVEAETTRFATPEHQAYLLDEAEHTGGSTSQIDDIRGKRGGEEVLSMVDGLFGKLGEDNLGRRVVKRGGDLIMEVS
jgi:hypothetical protein